MMIDPYCDYCCACGTELSIERNDILAEDGNNSDGETRPAIFPKAQLQLESLLQRV